MNKNWKRFFQLNRHHAEGFTLVELIVVIAILAILAGVAVPAYSGYIASANKAADQQILDAINNAYAAACLKDGKDMLTLGGANLKLTAEKKVESVDPYNDYFWIYYEGNKDLSFKVVEEVVFDPTIGMFCDKNDAKKIGYVYNGTIVAVDAETAELLANSSFGEIGASALLEKVDGVAGIAAILDNKGTYIEINDLASSLGMTYDEFEEWASEDGDNWDRYNAIVGNAMVLSAAETTVGSWTKSDLTDILSNPITTEQMKSTEGLAKAAALYSMYTAYKGGDVDASMGSLTKLAEASQDTDFQSYVNSDKGQQDLDAYLAAMKIVTDSSSNPADKQQIIENGFDNDDLEDLLSGLIGN